MITTIHQINSIRQIQSEQGWTDQTLLTLVFDWAISNHSLNDLRNHLQIIADEENDES